MVEGKIIHNFSAGPCVLPKEVMKQAADEMLSWHGSGVSVMEMSHRSKEFIEITEQAEKDFRDLMNLPKSGYNVFFFQGGASMQFSAIPYNLLGGDNKVANYLTTGAWSEGAFKECKKIAQPHEVWQGSGSKFVTVPDVSTWNINKEASYFHYCDNETIHGVEFPGAESFPFDAIPENQTLICDMSSNFCSRPINWEKYGVVYAGAQKNVGPAGVCISVIRDDLIGTPNMRKDTPLLFDWKVFRDAPTKFHNTPACYPIYVAGLNLAYMKKQGGLAHLEAEAGRKSQLLYDLIDSSSDYFSNPVDPRYRSRMNIPFRIKKDDKLEAKFLKEAADHGLIELKGHRSVGGCRASIYNAMTYEGVEALVNFMKKFRDENH
jgi:phosphoserine aminotransferase